jgi:hypothetical protein
MNSFTAHEAQNSYLCIDLGMYYKMSRLWENILRFTEAPNGILKEN